MVQVGVESEDGWRPAKIAATQLDRSVVPGTPIVIPLQIGIPNTILKALCADIHAYAESLLNARGGTDEGGWTPTNSVATSNHLNGTAVDLNWTDHPMGPTAINAGWTATEIAIVREILAFYTFEGLQLVWWAGDWDSPKDSMHFQMGYGTWQDQDKCLRFIAKFIRPDGFSTFRRGGGVPSVPRKAVIPDGGGTFWTDVSQYQSKTLDASYKSRVFSFRTNSGDKADTKAVVNAQVAKSLLDSGQLDIVIPYYFFRPGQANCDLHRQLLEQAGLFNHPRTVTMVDVEGDNGSVAGNNSWEINDEVNRIRQWYNNFQRVIGYLNSNADPLLWPTRAGINLVVPQYGRTAGDISSIQDSQVRTDAIAHQFTMTAMDIAPWTGENVDVNWTPYSVNELLVLFGMKEGPKVPTQDQMIRDIWDKVCAYPESTTVAGKWKSRALFRDTDDGVDDTVGMMLNTDGNAWDTKVVLGAMLGEEKQLSRVRRLANGQGPAGKNPEAVRYAQTILASVTEES